MWKRSAFSSDRLSKKLEMQKYFSIFLITLFCGLFCFAQSAASAENDFFGYYFIQNPTKAFADISEIHLAGTYGEQQKPKFYGLIRMKRKSAKDFQVLKPTVQGKNISFSTSAAAGVRYQFSGAFTKLGNFPETRPEGEIILKGTLQKFKGKIKIAEAKVSFSYSGGD